jgi:uncharacterized protein
MSLVIRDATRADFLSILRLNAESEHFLSAMDADRLQQLHAQASYHRVVVAEGSVLAFLLAFREGADYDSINYRWFSDRYPTFLYIDRVVVAIAAQGRKLGASLYRDLFEFARSTGVPTVTCEFDVFPPNDVSRRFHAAFGFREVGSQWVAGGKKQVSLQEAKLC